MKTKLNELLEFPTPFTYKVMGQALPELVDQVVEVVQRHAPGDYTPTVKPSSKGNYHSVSITINATHIEQVETLYEELGKIDIVRMVVVQENVRGIRVVKSFVREQKETEKFTDTKSRQVKMNRNFPAGFRLDRPLSRSVSAGNRLAGLWAGLIRLKIRLAGS